MYTIALIKEVYLGSFAGFPPVGAIARAKLCFSRRLVLYIFIHVHTRIVYSEWSPNELTVHCALSRSSDDVIFSFAFPSAICTLNREILPEKVLYSNPIGTYIHSPISSNDKTRTGSLFHDENSKFFIK